jgi:hypothetical protein
MKGLDDSRWPFNDEGINRSGVTQTEVRSRGCHHAIAHFTQLRDGLPADGGLKPYFSPDALAIGFDPVQIHLNPVLAIPFIVEKFTGLGSTRESPVGNKEVQGPVIVVIDPGREI